MYISDYARLYRKQIIRICDFLVQNFTDKIYRDKFLIHYTNKKTKRYIVNKQIFYYLFDSVIYDTNIKSIKSL